jgi:Tfp pilus assembly protein PilN
MIRVNLLPREEKAQRSAVSYQFKAGEVILPVALLVAVALVITGTTMSQRMSLASLTKSITDVESQSRALAPQIEKVNQLARERAELDLRLGVIHQLQQGRTQSVRLMDELARCVPDHLWLMSAVQDGSKLTLEGGTFSNLVVSDFMSSLERSSMFADVQLEIAERGDASGHPMVKFRVACQVTPNDVAQ